MRRPDHGELVVLRSPMNGAVVALVRLVDAYNHLHQLRAAWGGPWPLIEAFSASDRETQFIPVSPAPAGVDAERLAIQAESAEAEAAVIGGEYGAWLARMAVAMSARCRAMAESEERWLNPSTGKVIRRGSAPAESAPAW